MVQALGRKDKKGEAVRYPVVARVARLKSMTSIQASGRHKFREQETPNADPVMTPENTVFGAASSKALVDAVQARLALVTETIRKDAVPCLEYLFTAHQDAFRGPDAVDADAYFSDCLTYLRDKFGADNVVAAVVHRDESAPHLAAYVVPLVEVAAGTRRRSVFVGKGEDGKPLRETRTFPTPAGVRLSAAHYVGTRNKLRAFQDDMGAIGERHGLRRGTPGSSAQHTTIKEFYAAKASEPATPAPAARLSPARVQQKWLPDVLRWAWLRTAGRK